MRPPMNAPRNVWFFMSKELGSYLQFVFFEHEEFEIEISTKEVTKRLKQCIFICFIILIINNRIPI